MESGGKQYNEFQLPDVPSSSDSSPSPSDNEQDKENVEPDRNQEALRILEERKQKRKLEVAFGDHTDLQMKALYPNMAPPPLKKPAYNELYTDPLPFDTKPLDPIEQVYPSKRRSVQGNAKLMQDLKQQAIEKGDQAQLEGLSRAEESYQASLMAAASNAMGNMDGWRDSASYKTPSGQKMRMMRQADYSIRPATEEQLQLAAAESVERKKMILKEAARLAAEKKESAEKKKKDKEIKKMLTDSEDNLNFFSKLLTKLDSGLIGVKKHVTERVTTDLAKDHLVHMFGNTAQSIITAIGRQTQNIGAAMNNLSSNVGEQVLQLNQMETDMIILKGDVSEIKDILKNKCPHAKSPKSKTSSEDVAVGVNQGIPQANEVSGTDGTGADNGTGASDLFNSMRNGTHMTIHNNRASLGPQDNQGVRPLKKEFIEPTDKVQKHPRLGEIELAVGKLSGTLYYRLHDPLMRHDGSWFVHPEQDGGLLLTGWNGRNNSGGGGWLKMGGNSASKPGSGKAPDVANKENVATTANMKQASV